MKKIIIGARGSQLSLIQTDIIKTLLQPLIPNATIEIKIIKTTGDKDMSPIPLDTIGKGWFTKAIDTQLLENKIDLAVHSLKDLPETLPEGLIISAIPEREDAREALVTNNNMSLQQLKKGAVIGTDSTRRRVQILQMRKDLRVESVRGNVNRRLEKLDNKEYDGLCLAVAGLKRLGMLDRITQYFDSTDFIPSPGQGALAVVSKKNKKELNTLLAQMNHRPTIAAITAERAFSSAVGGGCKMPIGAYAECINDTITLYAMLGSLDAKHMIKDSLQGNIDNPNDLGKTLAKNLLSLSTSWYAKEFN